MVQICCLRPHLNIVDTVATDTKDKHGLKLEKYLGQVSMLISLQQSTKKKIVSKCFFKQFVSYLPHLSNGVFYVWVKNTKKWLHRRIALKQQYLRDIAPLSRKAVVIALMMYSVSRSIVSSLGWHIPEKSILLCQVYVCWLSS